MNRQPEVSPVSRVLLSELKRRFRKYTDPGDVCHEPLFLMATALDPRYRLILNPTQVDRAKTAILNVVTSFSVAVAVDKKAKILCGQLSNRCTTCRRFD